MGANARKASDESKIESGGAYAGTNINAGDGRLKCQFEHGDGDRDGIGSKRKRIAETGMKPREGSHDIRQRKSGGTNGTAGHESE